EQLGGPPRQFRRECANRAPWLLASTTCLLPCACRLCASERTGCFAEAIRSCSVSGGAGSCSESAADFAGGVSAWGTTGSCTWGVASPTFSLGGGASCVGVVFAPSQTNPTRDAPIKPSTPRRIPGCASSGFLMSGGKAGGNATSMGPALACE